MVSAMRAFPESEDVQSHGTGILAAMVSVPELALSMARFSGGSVCTLAAERFASDTEVRAPVVQSITLRRYIWSALTVL